MIIELLGKSLLFYKKKYNKFSIPTV